MDKPEAGKRRCYGLPGGQLWDLQYTPVRQGSVNSTNRNCQATLPQAGDVCIDVLGGHLADAKGERGSIVAFAQTALAQLPPLL